MTVIPLSSFRQCSVIFRRIIVLMEPFALQFHMPLKVNQPPQFPATLGADGQRVSDGVPFVEGVFARYALVAVIRHLRVLHQYRTHQETRVGYILLFRTLP